MRFERKFRIENMELRHVLLHLKIHPASFYRLYQDRTINNIYFDTPNMACAHDNLDGNNIRKKYRIRWYGKDQHTLTKPILEVKYKENLLGGKDHIALPDFKLSQIDEITKATNEAIPNQHSLQPVLLSSYDRSYWSTRDKKFRITIDHNLRFHSLLHTRSFKKYNCRDKAIIMEIKYEQEYENELNRITELFPFRLSKNSKYVNGLMLTL